MPAVYDLANRGLLPPSFALVGFARRKWENQDFAAEVKDAVKTYARTPFDETVWKQLSEGIRFVQGEFDDDDAFERLSETDRGTRCQARHAGQPCLLPVHPAEGLRTGLPAASKHGLAQAEGDKWRRVVIEKPFGHDLESARQLNDIVESVFPPDAVFRIDHYLGKETVQNILALRFANQLFEPLWNANYVDHVQITMAEDIGIGGRAGYYDGVGAARDVIQNHLLQLLALTAMEEPISFNADDLRAEKEKVLAAVRLPGGPVHAFGARPVHRRLAGRGKGPGLPGGRGHPRGLDHRDLCRAPAGHPYPALGRGAVLPAGGQAAGPAGDGNRRRAQTRTEPALPRHGEDDSGQNAVVIRVQPDEGVTIRFGSKVPGTQMEVRDVTMDFGYGHSFTESSPRKPMNG